MTKASNLPALVTPEASELKQKVETLEALRAEIAERKRVEQALRQSEEKYRRLFEMSPIGITTVNMKGVITECNPAVYKELGYSEDELVGKHFSKIATIRVRDIPKYIKVFGSIMRGKVPAPFEVAYTRKDGTIGWTEVHIGLLKADGRKLGIQVHQRDITERKLAEQALRNSEEKLRLMFNSVNDGITVTDLNGTITECNEETVRMHRSSSKSEILGKSAFELIAPRDIERATINMQRTLEEGSASGIEYTLLRADGTEFPGELSASILKDVSGNPLGFIAITRDITERKRMEEELKEAQEQLVRSERLAAIGQLASGVGHELRNPLGAMKNAVFYVRRKIAGSELSATEPKVLEFLDIIDGEVNSANKVITDLLGLSRVARPTVSSVNIGGVVEDALSRVAIPDNIELTKNLDPRLPRVMVDADQIRQVFVNIIINAIEAMPEGGRLKIRAKSKAEFVNVEFTDTGGGIPGSIIDKIFDPLFTTKAKGIGLGLAMCKSILGSHGGDIAVKSKEGKGATFTVSLPTRVV